MEIKFKKAQIGATLTWFVALFIIIFILVLFFIGSAALSKSSETALKKDLYFGLHKISLTNSIGYMLNRQVDLNEKKMTLDDFLTIYVNDKSSDTENDLRCFYKSLAKEFQIDSGYYPDLIVDGKNIFSPNGKSCEDLLLESSFFLASSKGNSEVNISLFNCDILFEKEVSPKPTWWNKLYLKYEIYTMQKNNIFYDSDCVSIDAKRTMVKLFEDISNPPIVKPLLRSSEEAAKVDKILADKKDISLGTKLFTYSASKDLWISSIGDTKIEVGFTNMRANLIGEEGGASLDILGAVFEGGVWKVGWKNV